MVNKVYTNKNEKEQILLIVSDIIFQYSASKLPHALTASSKPSSQAPWKVGDTWSAEEMLDGQQQRVDISAQARTAHKGFQQKRL